MMSKSQYAFSFSLVMVVTISWLGCARAPQSSALVIKTPTQYSAQGKAMNQSMAVYPTTDNGQICYAVNVIGGGIEESSSACGPNKGKFAGTVMAGGSLSLDVPKGTGRTVELYLYMASTGESCPQWEFTCSTQQNCRLYKVGSLTNVDMSGDVTNLTINASFPGWDQNVVTNSGSPLLCQARLRGMLASSGDVLDELGSKFPVDLSTPTNESFYSIDGRVDVITSSGVLSNFPGTRLSPIVRSVTQKPDNLKLYGIVGLGMLVEVDSQTGGWKALDSTSCPFATCQVPPWIQSVSAGLGQSLFGLDHGGKIYKLNSTSDFTIMPLTVSPTINQISFF